jgi:multiple sugar transport system permease protein
VTLFTSDPRYLQSLKVTVIYVATSVPLKLAFALLLAAALNRGIRGVGVYRTIFYLPALIGGSVAIAIMWRQLFGAEGLVNQALALVGLQGPSWISDPRFALDTLVALAVWQVGAPMVIFLAGLKQIPRELYEAATVDGAGPVARFVHVTIPVITPLIFFNLVLQMIGSFQSFNPAYIISGGSGGPADATLFYTLYLYNQAFTQLHMGYAAAMAWVLLVLVASVTVLNFLGSRYWVFYQDQAGTA